MACHVLGINCYVFLALVCGIATLCNLDFYFHPATKRYIFASPIRARWNLFKSYVKGFWAFCKRQVKGFWTLCKRCIKIFSDWVKHLKVSFKKNPSIHISYTLFLGLLLLFGWFFYCRLYPFIDKLYMAINAQIMGIDIGDDAFRNASLSIGGSITLSIALLGVILTVIRNILTRQQNNTDEERLVTEQISRAIDQIGTYKQTADGKKVEPNIEVRLGGLYSLQRIMKDSPKDEEAIAKIFYAYVRENAKR